MSVTCRTSRTAPATRAAEYHEREDQSGRSSLPGPRNEIRGRELRLVALQRTSRRTVAFFLGGAFIATIAARTVSKISSWQVGTTDRFRCDLSLRSTRTAMLL